MSISIEVTSGDYTLISSGTLLTINGEPVRMTIIAFDDRLVSVELHFHSDRHHESRSLIRQFSEDGLTHQWHIYTSANGDSARTISPVPVLTYDDEGIMKSIYLQLHTTRLQDDGPVKVEYTWWSGVKSSGIQ